MLIMGREDWYRNKDWNAEIESAFLSKLRRARDRSQYLRIQACTLSGIKPEVALRLLDEYFKLPEGHDYAQAWVDRASALVALGRVEEAIQAYESALLREAEFPKSLTQAYLAMPYLIATRSLTEYFERAIRVLDSHVSRLMFPVDRFMWNAAHAIIASSNQKGDASLYATAALKEADENSSGFQYHQGVGLVSAKHSEVVKRLKVIAHA
jgi:tetratricopeptide (TPR) repeat protein